MFPEFDVQAHITCEDCLFFLALMLTVFATQADFTDVSVLPVIVSRLQEEQVEVIIFGCPDKKTKRQKE